MNIMVLSAVLVSHVPLSCWLNDVAEATVAEVEGAGRLGEDEARRDRGQPTHLPHALHLPHIPRVQILIERLGIPDCSGVKCVGVRRRKCLESVFVPHLHI